MLPSTPSLAFAATLEAAADGSGQPTLRATLLPQGGAGGGAGGQEGAAAPDPAQVSALLAQAKVG